MSLTNNLKLIKYLDEITIEERETDYKIQLKDICYGYEDPKPLYANIDKKTNKVTYYMENLYNNGFDCEEIDMEQLEKLSKIITAIKGE